MKYLKFLLRTRGLSNTFYRAIRIFQRFGITPRKARKNLLQLSDIAQRFHFQPSLPSTAIIVERHPEVFKQLQERRIELAVHGLYHRDFNQMSFEEQYDHIRGAASIFQRHGISYNGFRAPYLSWNSDTLEAVKKHRFSWDSNKCILWDVLNEEDYSPRKWEAYQKVLQYLYKPLHSNKYFSLPREIDGFVEIPVSIPEDEIITDRLGISEIGSIENILTRILKESYHRGELFTMMLHHERIPIFLGVLQNILDSARSMNPSVWIASLNEIALWWKAKMTFRWNLTNTGDGKFKVALEVPDEGQVLLKNISSVDCDSEPFDNFLRVRKSVFEVASRSRPAIGVSENNSPRLKKFLSEEGWVHEISKNRSDYSLYLDGYSDFDSIHEKNLSSTIMASDSPFIRLWRWPNGAKSALSVTGDIDCLTLIDFFMRIFKR